ncbi:Peptidyl-prolyl cis-trans isomerase [Macleaya cordata]|uniref:peptidylprolyl isomerase n=1 Tax=Macleaya cordata TaxID=56857 RepID=A0A200PYK8_MACCD|nr:Peptidyl-prolyl cis-trans isomerase [Macleaya cordata]
MAVSTLTVSVAKPNLLLHQGFKPKPSSSFSFKPTLCCSSESSSNGGASNNLSPQPISMAKRQIFGVGIGILASSMLIASPLDANATRIEYYATVGEPPCEFSYAKSGLGYCDIAVGFGDEAPIGELINVHYTARFADGIVFDSSYKRARPLTMRIGVGKVIKGLDQGIVGGEGVPPMLVGGKRKLKIPPELAYGPEPAGCFSG